MTDIVQRLRGLDLGIPQEIYAVAQEAADEIERLRKQLARTERLWDFSQTALVSVVARALRNEGMNIEQARINAKASVSASVTEALKEPPALA